MTHKKAAFILLCLLCIPCFLMADTDASPRQVLSLDGTWQIAEGNLDLVPASFDHAVPVPGLVTLAQPGFVEPAPRVADTASVLFKDRRRDAFWYHRTFRVEQPVPAVAMIKVLKAMFGTRVILNGQPLGEHLPCFTPGYFNAKDALKQGENELVIRVGADRDAVGLGIPSGTDFEKVHYIPGIFDSVELIMSATPHIVNVQAAPDIENKTVRVQALIRNDGAETEAGLKFVVREAKSGKVVGTLKSPLERLTSGAEKTVDVRIPVEDCHLWSPEDPFLYNLEASSDTDRIETRFGMREFHLDPTTGHAVLNGKPYFMRGSNVTLYRFFEDSQCKDLPWRTEWVRDLHRSFKKFHWNCLRYCICFPPEKWYRIADEEGFLIQDEFPIWLNPKAWPPALNHKELIREYTEWMQERWNHPCVVIWDAQNETFTTQDGITSPVPTETGIAVHQVRGLDLSNRPWDNGMGKPDAPGDSFEWHPYHFGNGNLKFRLTDMPTAAADPKEQHLNPGSNPLIVNEYGGIWLNRDGTPTTLTAKVWLSLLGLNSTTAQRFHMYARCMAAETEFWRSRRKCAAVMQFTALGYSRPDGQTSDNFVDVEKLVYEPEFLTYVSDAFAPVGLMIDYWNEKPVGGDSIKVPVVLSNDLNKPWSGNVTLRVLNGKKAVTESVQPCKMEAFGQATPAFELKMPAEPGSYTIEAELRGADGNPVRSVREIEIIK